jgi:DNA-binding response OmpR family regulator
LFKVLIAAHQTEQVRQLSSGLAHKGFSCSIIPDGENAIEQVIEQGPDLVLIAMDGSLASSGMSSLLQRITGERQLPIIALLSKRALDRLDSRLNLDDFVVEPWDATEVAARAKRVLWRNNNVHSEGLIKCGDLVIDVGRCEVSIDGRLAALTFREYELLKFLASNGGRVFTRETLLNRVWGYDYYGGDRTVDVHIRRLRSKLEGTTHNYIETVRNIGYRFREET